MYGNFAGKIGVVDRHRASDEARAVLGERGCVRGVGAPQEAIASTSGLWSAGASEKRVESSEGGPGQARDESRRHVSSAGLSSCIFSDSIGVQN